MLSSWREQGVIGRAQLLKQQKPLYVLKQETGRVKTSDVAECAAGFQGCWSWEAGSECGR